MSMQGSENSGAGKKRSIGRKRKVLFELIDQVTRMHNESSQSLCTPVASRVQQYMQPSGMPLLLQ